MLMGTASSLASQETKQQNNAQGKFNSSVVLSNNHLFLCIANTYQVSLNLQEAALHHLCQCNLMLGPLLTP